MLLPNKRSWFQNAFVNFASDSIDSLGLFTISNDIFLCKTPFSEISLWVLEGIALTVQQTKTSVIFLKCDHLLEDNEVKIAYILITGFSELEVVLEESGGIRFGKHKKNKHLIRIGKSLSKVYPFWAMSENVNITYSFIEKMEQPNVL
jgi:hypothetical protein